jgi:16S rRNA processing protein RimM
MPRRPARTARSSSRSSKRSEPARPQRDGPVAATGETLAVGEVVGAHALRGLLRVRPYQPAPTSLSPGRSVLLEERGGCRRARIGSAVPHGRGLVLLGLEGVADRTAAEGLVGARLLVPTAELPPLAGGEFYYHEIVGFRVETEEGRALGVVTETFSTGVNDVWVVRDGDEEHLIPVIADVVRVVDREGRRVLIRPLPGLLA